MAFHYTAYNLCFNRSLQSCRYSPYKIVLFYNGWYLAKKGLSSHSRNNHSGDSSFIHLQGDSKGRPVVTEEMIKSDVLVGYADDVPEEPTTCCMSGCANCVWIEYAEELSKRFKDGGEKAREAIMKISDPNMRAFLMTELKTSDKS